MKEIQELLTAEELAERLRVSTGTIRMWARCGRIPAIRLSPKVVRDELAAVVRRLQEEQVDNTASGGSLEAGGGLAARPGTDIEDRAVDHRGNDDG